ncbi:anhydro-N-acetylmuramic acid kinase [Algibacter amylolyticus]|uniref:Anhydro-N-acetylmuramic acid kinase n=1 Tax=Algibacter amylolyticus TaxID=1608400 RepID=A0A5M7BGS4_9FLAO|nr:anhydro-N-acetylmuramic acid kinase [Algibacter amylolyticus]KAA5828073.1 anhydro-N-acetylmuramic acid kinase [Algibacter amylolyticus]MBB5267321.1 anhydro-N-acetylmuramic acid kinase [Algibacter amylolyticus]TSJ82318.1 anhydro-N-acetylmuramic acid kinase [Algibacter amylolyticus]
MIKDEYNVIGVMSGTSLDGIDLVYATFSYNDGWDFKILNAETVAYSSYWYTVLKDLISKSLDELKNIDLDYTAYLGVVIQNFITKHQISTIDAVCSHGHTALHQPEHKLTYQIGNLPVLADILKETVVCDFRVQDVELGGQGAPLVPIGDQLLFSQYDYCLNLGGFANISMELDGARIAYDVCPVNIVLNKYAKQLGFDYDDGGQIAASGSELLALGNLLNALEFYKAKPPKSLGLEWVNKNIFPLLDAAKLEEKDVLKTFSNHIAHQIAWVLKKDSKVLVTGGGAYNDYIISKIKLNKQVDIIIPEPELVEFKEALIFAFLGILKLRNEVNCLNSVTGAMKNHSSGKIFLP